MKFGQIVVIQNGVFDGSKGWILDIRDAGYQADFADREAYEYLVRIFLPGDQYYDRWFYEKRLLTE